MNPVITVIIGIAAAAVGIAVGFFIRKAIAEKKVGSAEEQARRII